MGESQSWGDIEPEPEVVAWLRSLSEAERHHVAFYIDLLEERGPTLDFPYTSQLSGKLRELRFYLRRQQWRITYFIAAERRIVLLTVFRKTRGQERGELARAVRAMDAWAV
jgi:hypothetical protein